ITFTDSGADVPQLTTDDYGLNLPTLYIEPAGTGSFPNDTQKLWRMATGGTFALNFSGQLTRQLPWDATASQVKAALEELQGINRVSVAGRGIQSDPWIVTFDDHAGRDVPALTSDSVNLRNAPRYVTTTTPGGRNEVQRLWTDATGGTFDLHYGTSQETLAYN